MQSCQCATCAHYYPNLDRLAADREGIAMNGCEAFPEGVPPEVLGGEVDHRNTYSNDRGVTWVQAEGHSSPFPYEEEDVDISTFSLVCSLCVHLVDEDARLCEAFPRGIPTEIWHNENDHREPFDGDHGIQFKRRE